MTDAPPPELRILIGAGSYADAAAALRIVERLADTFCAGLGGILVEEETLDICQIPNQRVIQASGTTLPAPSPAQIRTLMQAEARAFRHSLAKAVRPRETHWSFAQESGALVHTSLDAANGWDVLIIGYRQVHRMPGKIVILGDQQPSAKAMDAIAARLSDQLRAETIRFDLRDAQPRQSHGVFRFENIDEILIALSRLNAATVLLDLRKGPVRNQTDLTRVLEAARCPVIVFGAAAQHTQLMHSAHMPPVSTA